MPLAFKNVSGFNTRPAVIQATYGWYKAEINKPDINHTTQEYGDPVVTINDTIATITYPIVELLIETARENALKRLSHDFETIMQRPVVSVVISGDRNINVDGGRENLQDYISALDLSSTSIMSADNILYTVTPVDWAAIILAVRQNGESLYREKWTKRAAILASTDNQQIRDA